MKIKRSELKQIIQEEIQGLQKEFQDPGAHVRPEPGSPLERSRARAYDIYSRPGTIVGGTIQHNPALVAKYEAILQRWEDAGITCGKILSALRQSIKNERKAKNQAARADYPDANALAQEVEDFQVQNELEAAAYRFKCGEAVDPYASDPEVAYEHKDLYGIVLEELKAVLENVPNLDFQRRAHGGKTCDEWSQEISEFKALLQDARVTYDNLGYDLRQKVEDGDDTGGAYEAYLESGADVVEKAEVALKNAQTAAKRQKCQVATSPRRQPKRPKNKALELLKTIGDDIINWPRDVARVLNYYYGDGSL